MSAGFPKDDELKFPSCTVVTASAGSGKTHTLTWRFLQLLLSDRVPNNSLNNILAITFTNQATREMRQRLLNNLKDLSLGADERLQQAEELLVMPRHRIVEKAGVVLSRILDNYADLQIRTIDSFMAKVFRTSSFDFGFRPDIEVVMDTRELMTDALERLMRELRVRPDLPKILDDLVKLIDETRANSQTFLWDPYSRILREIRELYSRLSSRTNDILDGGGLSELAVLRGDVAAAARKLRDTITRSGFRINKLIESDLQLAEEGQLDKVVQRTEKSAEKLVSRSSGDVRKGEYETLLPLLRGQLDEYNRLLQEFCVWKARNHYQPYVQAIRLVDRLLNRLKRQRGQIFIDDINKLLHPFLREEGAVDAYVMLGEQIYHFLIDEFQDTSPIQWANLHPLLENSLSQGGSLFVVGDTRQSIYGFRDADWRIMKRLKETREFASVGPTVVPLKTNWRSGEEIIRYTTHVFEKNIAGSEYAVAAQLSGLSEVAQDPIGKHRRQGIAETILIPWDEEQRPERQEILSLLRDCCTRGFDYGDIAILTPTNERVLEVSSWLNQATIPVLPFSNLDIRTRKITGEILALLRFLDAPVDNLAFSSFILGDLFTLNLEHENVHLSREELRRLLEEAARKGRYKSLSYKVFQSAHSGLWTSFFQELYQLVGYLPVYDILAEVFRRFRVFRLCPDEEASLVKFLEVARIFGEGETNSLKDFLRFADEEGHSSTWEVPVPPETNAVRVMTIHKAKGLEFELVIVLLYDRDERSARYFFHEEAEGTRLLWISSKLKTRVPSLGEIAAAQELNDAVDRLNKLYVVLTRAKQEMYVIGVEGEKNMGPSKFLVRENGQLTLKPRFRKQAPAQPERLAPFHHETPVLYGETSGERITFLEVNRGELVHRVLSLIEYLSDDVEETAIESLLRQLDVPAIPGLNILEVQSTLATFLKDPSIRLLFERKEGRSIRRECEYASRDGLLYRMDRVLIDPDRVTVIDFKTGESEGKEEYRKQISTYMSILGEVYPGREPRGILAYVDRLSMETIP
jgi:ATP-dependent exoDNAse (exonuclease V) beta subunit